MQYTKQKLTLQIILSLNNFIRVDTNAVQYLYENKTIKNVHIFFYPLLGRGITKISNN